MFAGCPPDGSALLAPRALLPPTASPISFYSKRFKLNRRLRTRWHGACFSMRAWRQRRSAAICRAPVSTGRRIAHRGEREAH